MEVGRDILTGLRHGIDAVLLLHQRVDEAPAGRGVARERAAETPIGVRT